MILTEREREWLNAMPSWHDVRRADVVEKVEALEEFWAVWNELQLRTGTGGRLDRELVKRFGTATAKLRTFVYPDTAARVDA